MSKVSLIVMDVDGTLLNSSGQITAGVKRALQAASGAGIVLALGTGRVLDECAPLLSELPWITHTINCTGASVFDLRAQKEIFTDPMPMEAVREVFGRVKQVPGMFEVMAEGHVYSDRARMLEVMKSFGHYYLEVVSKTRTPVDMEEFLRTRTAPANKIHMVFTKAEDQKKAAAATADLNLMMLSSIPENYEFNMPGVDKGVGLKALAAYLNIPLDAVMAIGDNTNDAGMLRDAGYPVLMGNHHPDAAAYGKYKTDTCDNDGVAKAIYAVLNGTMEELRI